MKFGVIIEESQGNYSAYIPDLPGCVATGATKEETFEQIKEAISFHLQGLIEDGLQIPQPKSSFEYIEA